MSRKNKNNNTNATVNTTNVKEKVDEMKLSVVKDTLTERNEFLEKLCYMTQEELKVYLKGELTKKGGDVICQDGFLYRKGTVPVLLTAHMDTVHTERPREMVYANGTLSSSQGIGGDDRCGIYMILKLIEKHDVSVLFCEDEEKGCVGADKFAKTEYIKNLDVKYMIQLDRRGSRDLVFYSCDNKEFTKWVEEKTGYKTNWGTCSDISRLMPASKIAGVNFSCGYYSEHTKKEYIVLSELENTLMIVSHLLGEEIPKVFEYVPKKYSSYGGNYGGYNYWGDRYKSKTKYGNYGSYAYADDYDYYNDYDEDEKELAYYVNKTKEQKANEKKREAKRLEKETKMTVIVDDVAEDFYGENEIVIWGSSKLECWFNLFDEYSDLCKSQVIDYWYE